MLQYFTSDKSCWIVLSEAFVAFVFFSGQTLRVFYVRCNIEAKDDLATYVKFHTKFQWFNITPKILKSRKQHTNLFCPSMTKAQFSRTILTLTASHIQC